MKKLGRQGREQRNDSRQRRRKSWTGDAVGEHYLGAVHRGIEQPRDGVDPVRRQEGKQPMEIQRICAAVGLIQNPGNAAEQTVSVASNLVDQENVRMVVRPPPVTLLHLNARKQRGGEKSGDEEREVHREQVKLS